MLHPFMFLRVWPGQAYFRFRFQSIRAAGPAGEDIKREIKA
jgi:hypothetical protein